MINYFYRKVKKVRVKLGYVRRYLYLCIALKERRSVFRHCKKNLKKVFKMFADIKKARIFAAQLIIHLKNFLYEQRN